MTLEQRRAHYAWQCVQGCNASDYDKLVKGAPALIMSNGLMQSLAFWQEKGKKQARYAELVKHLCGWLRQRFPEHFPTNSYADVMQGLFNSEDRTLYRRATDETLALLRWLRQFAAAR